jgi:peptidoglycan/LPS O-acetylase OafA/YrhL
LPMTSHHQGIMGNFRLVVGLAMSMLVSWVSFRFYESHIIRWGRRKANALSAFGGRRVVTVQPSNSAQG